MQERGVHDVGGLEGAPIEHGEHAVSLFEKRVDALVMLMVHPSVAAFRVDALRRAVESNSAAEYAELGYYTKWLRAVRDLLIEQGVLSGEEIAAKIALLRAAA